MIVVLFPFFLLLLAPARRLAEVVGARVEVERGHADLREGELIGAVVVAAIGELVGEERAALMLENGARDRIERGLAVPDRRQVARAPAEIAAVVVDVGGDAPGRDRRMQRVVLRAQQ